MKIIKTNCRFAYEIFVSDCDYEKLKEFKWYANTQKQIFRCKRRRASLRTFFIHREILEAKDGEIVDHINRNTLDNQRENLRIVSGSQNNFNAGKKTSTWTKYKGIKKCSSGKFEASFMVDRRTYSVGTYIKEESAAFAYNVAVNIISKQTACLNEIPEDALNPPLKLWIENKVTSKLLEIRVIGE